MNLVSSKVEYKGEPAPPAPPPVATKKLREVDVSDDDLSQAKRTLYSEFSNRPRPIEITAMLNVALNEAQRRKVPVQKVLQDGNFFQGVTNKRYATSSELKGPDKEAYAFVSSVVDQAVEKGLDDHTKGATHFVHVTSGPNKNAVVTMTEKEFEQYLKRKGKERDAYALSLVGL